jgi:hypothetical protein
MDGGGWDVSRVSFMSGIMKRRRVRVISGGTLSVVPFVLEGAPSARRARTRKSVWDQRGFVI